MWQEGTIGIPVTKTVEKEYIAVHYTIKVFDEPSKFGINHGKISKLELRQDGELSLITIVAGIFIRTLRKPNWLSVSY